MHAYAFSNVFKYRYIALSITWHYNYVLVKCRGISFTLPSQLFINLIYLSSQEMLHGIKVCNLLALFMNILSKFS